MPRSFNARACLVLELGPAIQFAMTQRDSFVAEGHLHNLGAGFL